MGIGEFREAGYIAEALVNFLALIGWAPDGETTVISRDEIVARFRLEDVSPSPGTFDYAKLDWLNGVYLRALEPREYADRLVLWVGEHGLDWPAERVHAAAPLVQEKIARLAEFPAFAGFLFGDVEPDPAVLDGRTLDAATAALGDLEPWSAEAIEARLKELCEELGEKPRTVYVPIRVAVTGSRVSPGLYESLELLGREATLERLRRGVEAAADMTPRTVTEYEARLDAFGIERAEEARAVRVGEKETSEQAAIVARYADLFTQEQLDALRAAEAAADDAQREAVARLRLTCQDGIVTRELAEDEDALENALLGARVPWDGDELPLRSAQARLAVEPDYARRSALGEAVLAVSTTFDDERRSLLTARNALEGDVSGIADPVARSEDEKGGVLLRPILDAVDTARVESTPAFTPAREHWFDRLLGPERDDVPPSAHAAWIRRLSPLEATYTKEASVPVCVATLARLGFDLAAEPGIRTDLDDRPQKSPRACVIPSDPPRLVHLITRAQGGLHDYEAFLHEAGHALHYAGCDPALPLAFRRLSRDHALTEIYSFLLDSIVGRSGLARGALRADRRRGRGERPRGALLEHAALPPLLGEARLRARLLVALPDGGPDAGRLRGAAHRRDGRPLPRSEPPRRHGRGVLLGRLSPRVDPRGPGARVPPAGGRPRLVAERGDRRAAPRPLPRGHAADDRGGRRADRLRPAGHGAARRRPDALRSPYAHAFSPTSSCRRRNGARSERSARSRSSRAMTWSSGGPLAESESWRSGGSAAAGRSMNGFTSAVWWKAYAAPCARRTARKRCAFSRSCGVTLDAASRSKLSRSESSVPTSRSARCSPGGEGQHLAHDRRIERIARVADAREDVDLVDRGEVAGVDAAIDGVADPMRLEVRADVPEEPVDGDVAGQPLVEGEHVVQRLLGEVEEVSGERARDAVARGSGGARRPT